MSDLKENAFYRKGVDVNLDLAYSVYKRTRIQAGDAWTQALSSNEKELMVNAWRKERTLPLYVHEVKMLTDFCRRIIEQRKLARTEDARIRKSTSRKRLNKGAEHGGAERIKHIVMKTGSMISSKKSQERKQGNMQIKKARKGMKKLTKNDLKKANRIRKQKSRKRLRIAAECGQSEAKKKQQLKKRQIESERKITVSESKRSNQPVRN